MSRFHSEFSGSTSFIDLMHLQDALQSTLAREKEKFSDALKHAVKEAQAVTEKEMERKREVKYRNLVKVFCVLKCMVTS